MYESLFILFIIILCASASKQIVEKTPIFSRICLYILNLLVFYLTFIVQRKAVSTKKTTFLETLGSMDTIDYPLIVISFYPFILLFLFGLSRVYKDYENGKELSNFINLTIVACVLSLMTPGTSYLILSVIIIDLIVLFTKKTEKVEIRYLALVIIWFLLILFNYIILR